MIIVIVVIIVVVTIITINEGQAKRDWEAFLPTTTGWTIGQFVAL